jgi:small multidrug resistance family-3 protein
MRIIVLFVLAGVLEIGGGYLVWMWLRQQRALGWGLAGFAVLALYGVGRIYAAYGAVFIALSALWGWWIDGQRPDLRDVAGVVICLAGASIMMSPRS